MTLMTKTPSFSRPSRLLGAALLTGLLVGCTGTQESVLDVRLGLLTDGGKTLGYVDQNTSSGGVLSGSFTQVRSLDPDTGMNLLNLNSGSNAILTTAGSIQQLDANLVNPVPFGGFDVAFRGTPCLVKSVLSPTADRLFTLSDCNGNQLAALYNINRTLIWYTESITPPTANASTSTDAAPTRIAVLGDTAIISRPVLGGGSEIIRIGPRNSGDPAQDLKAVVNSPVGANVSIRDLAAVAGSPSVIYAATDTGVRPLLATGLPDSSANTASQVAFGTDRVDRLWSGVAGSRRVLVAWRDNAKSGRGSEPLRLWDVTQKAAVSGPNFTDVRDVTFDLNSQMYVLTRNILSRQDTALGFQQNNWNGTTLLSSLNDARSLTWLIPPVR